METMGKLRVDRARVKVWFELIKERFEKPRVPEIGILSDI